MKKRVFQILDAMNIADSENGTALVGLCPGMLSARLGKHGTHIEMGAPKEAIANLMSGKTIPVLLLINAEEYEKRETAE